MPGPCLSSGAPNHLLMGEEVLHWVLQGALPTLKYSTESESTFWRHQISRGLGYLAYPRPHRFPWSVSDIVENARVCKSLLRQSFNNSKRLPRPAMQTWLTRFVGQTRTDQWLAAAAHQRLTQVWQHANGLTGYQV